jgi:hypothetical protein
MGIQDVEPCCRDRLRPAFVERNVEDPDLGLCTSFVAGAEKDEDSDDPVSDYWDLVP